MDDKNYIQEIAEKIRQHFRSNELPKDGLSDLFNSYAVLALTKGAAVTNEDVHDAWAAWAAKYSPESDSLVPYDQLSKSVQDEDSKFTAAIKEVAKTLR